MLSRKRTAIVTTVHDVAFATNPAVYDPSSRQRQERAVHHALRRAMILLTPSHATKHDLESHYHVASDRIVVTPLAPTMPRSSKDASDVLRTFQIGAGQYVLSLSRLEKKKNTAMLIRAFANVKRKLGVGNPLTLVLAGTFGYGKEGILRIIREEQIEDAVRLPGYVSDDDASVLLANALCFAFPSIAEGFGIPVLEAMEHGAPVIASSIPVMREVCGDAAVLVSPNDIRALALAILRMTDTHVRDEYREKGLQHYSKFSWTTSAHATWEALRMAAQNR